MRDDVTAKSADIESIVAAVSDEFIGRVERGESPNIEEYSHLYPQAAAILRKVLPALQVLRPGFHEHDLTENSRPVGVKSRQLGDFRIVREIGRGGMGVVYEAQQLSLRRQVALKVLPFAAALDEKQIQRFKNEAHAAAALQHGNIVPVYCVGEDEGVHFYAMQFIKGHTLTALIDELRHLNTNETCDDRPVSQLATRLASGKFIERASAIDTLADSPSKNLAQAVVHRPDPCTPSSTVQEVSTQGVYANSTEDTRRWDGIVRTAASLGRQAALALEHAHQCGVIHRDIKPGNLILDMEGRLWITDFGLAQLQTDSGLTQTGDLIGTIRYMSPEQAMAKRVSVDHRTDVYSLGATLYELLTLQPAHASSDRSELLHSVITEEPRSPRKINWQIPADLETIVLKAMAKCPTDRYISAEELADDFQRFLNDEPIHARRPTMTQRIGNWSRRHRTFVRFAVLLLMISTIGLAVGTVLVTNQRNIAEANLTLANQAIEQEKQARTREQAMTHRARQAVDEMYTQVAERWLSQSPHMEPLQREFLEKALAFYEDFAQDRGRDSTARFDAAVAARRVGELHHRLGAPSKAQAAFKKAIEQLDQLDSEFPDIPRQRHGLALALSQLAIVLEEMGFHQEAVPNHRRAIQIESQLVASSPDIAEYRQYLAMAQHNLGNAHPSDLTINARTELLMSAVNTMQTLTEEFPDRPDYQLDLAQHLELYGRLQLRNGGNAKTDGVKLTALEANLRAIEILEALIERHPEISAYRDVLGVSLCWVAHDFPNQDGEKRFDRAISLQERLVQDYPRVTNYQYNLFRSLFNKGRYLVKVNRPKEAEALYRRSAEIGEKLATASPGIHYYWSCVPRAQVGLGNVLRSREQYREAAQSFRQAIEFQKQFLIRFPEIDGDTSLKDCYDALAECVKKGDAVAAAETVWLEAIDFVKQMQNDSPLSLNLQELSAHSHLQLSGMYKGMHKVQASQRAYDMGISISDSIALQIQDTASTDAGIIGVHAHWRVAESLQTIGRIDEAEDRLKKAIELLRLLIARDPQTPFLSQELGYTYWKIGWLNRDAGRIKHAEQPFRDALAVHEQLSGKFPENALYRDRLRQSRHFLDDNLRQQ